MFDLFRNTVLVSKTVLIILMHTLNNLINLLSAIKCKCNNSFFGKHGAEVYNLIKMHKEMWYSLNSVLMFYFKKYILLYDMS